ncbi:DUF4381 domain-containing protein [Chitinophaga sp. RCC_12]|uniref:DUF4381 domain-containing protein n=1 Tax=Chitinophaga sp. RCC_12 TaxID=3239226 RepID=UPI003523B791
MQQPLQQFGDLIEPAPVPFSFHTPGWYVTEVVFILLLLMGAYLFARYRRRNRYRRYALLWLGERMITLHAQQEYMQQIYEADMLMKRIAMKVYGREEVAGLRGNEWVTFLNQRNRRRDQFSAEEGQLLAETLYSHSKTVDKTETDRFISKTNNWIRYHKNAPGNRI